MKYPLLVGALFPVAVLAVAVPLALRPATVPATQTAPATSAPPAAVPTSPAAPTPAVPAAAPEAQVTPEDQPAAPPATNSTTVQYAEQVRGALDQAASGAYTTDASYAVDSLPADTPALADGEHVDLVRANCSVCHATTFITSQPPLPAATWHDEVYKMKEKYGATFISDENAEKIIAYLSAHYTPETRQTPDRALP